MPLPFPGMSPYLEPPLPAADAVWAAEIARGASIR